ncbi:adenylosuccinate synthetase [Amycolatopsis regifaucium]|uniref:Adenylosuccinate synthetase n=1 Tax=Amycolatopsis regifaucium TaxID=546365 RepID=A0A154MWR0_9PSEU|nr:adenylosuccinate synthetase [Amycolatopsis regifaucium]KZB88187.1 adenylosuccinate synthetase [Amycolatopsis regifaucium]OKA04312.1 adenylosuccinate synthetase [Amycolatopsis regifaucium]SFH46354.1 adenylosuccinate synthase [Amycolatopsis regifaucium]
MSLLDGHAVVVGLGFGDEGKGAVVDALCADRPTIAVVRFNGGAQAAHNVVENGRHHTFSQFGAGTFAGVPTHLSRFVLVEPFALAAEARQLETVGVADPLSMLSVDGRALLTTPFHVYANRAREDARGAKRHGSCGKGIGETVWYSLLSGAARGDRVEEQEVIGTPGEAPTVADCARPAVLRRKLDALARFYAPLATPPHGVDELVALYRDFADAMRITDGDETGRLADSGRVVFEGAQGVLLDQHHGFHPHTTWSTTTPHNARTLLGGRPHTVLGVTRTYLTRHGAGPLPTESASVLARFPEAHNGTGEYQGAWRAGHLDAALLDYAIAACEGVDAFAVTHLDATGLKVVPGDGCPAVDLPDPLTWFGARLPVAVTGYGPDRAGYRVVEARSTIYA